MRIAPLRIAELNRMVIVRAEPVSQHEGGDTERIEEIRRRPAFVVHGEGSIASAGGDDDRGHGTGRVRRHVHRDGRLVALLGSQGTGCASGPEQNRLRVLQDRRRCHRRLR